LATKLHNLSVEGEMVADTSADLRYLEPSDTVIAGTSGEGLAVRTGTEVIGRLRGFIVDPLTRRLQYLVVQTSGWLGRLTVFPFTEARIDVDSREIELLDERVIDDSQPFRPGMFPQLSEDDRLTAIFASRPAA
jgi:hypothetical protein